MSRRSRLQRHGFAVARQVIGPLALDLDGGILRRGLFDLAGELRQQLGNRLGGGPDVAGFDNAALGIVGIAFLAPAHRKTVALAAVHHERNGFGGFPHGDRQPAGSQRIERAGMAGALGLEQPLHDRDRMGRGHADRLVEHHPAVDVALVAPRLALVPLLVATPLLLSDRCHAGIAMRIRKIIFFSAVRITDRRLDGAVCGGHDHQLTLPNLANLVRGLFAPQVFAVISLFVPLHRIVHRRGSGHQVRISG